MRIGKTLLQVVGVLWMVLSFFLVTAALDTALNADTAEGWILAAVCCCFHGGAWMMLGLAEIVEQLERMNSRPTLREQLRGVQIRNKSA